MLIGQLAHDSGSDEDHPYPDSGCNHAMEISEQPLGEDGF